jgi:alcohol dehydrogenase class IV
MDLAMGDFPWREQWLASGHAPSPDGPIPQIIAVPTLAGSGAEATGFATVWAAGCKRSLEHSDLRPCRVIVDPSLAATAEPGLRLVSALDGLTHALEAIWNRNATSESDALAVRAIAQFASAFSRDKTNSGDDFPWLGEASWLAGSAIAITRTSLCHAISYPFTAELDVPHGLAVSFTIGEVAHRVASGHPERAALIGRGLRCEPDAIGRALENLISRSGARDRQASALPPDALDKLSGRLADVTRAGTFLDTVDEQVARDVAMRALARLHS